MTVLDTQLLQRATVYIDGQWREPHGVGTLDVENPATGEVFGHVPRADVVDVDAAVAAAKAAFETWSDTTPRERFEQIRSEMSGRAAAANLLRKDVGEM